MSAFHGDGGNASAGTLVVVASLALVGMASAVSVGIALRQAGMARSGINGEAEAWSVVWAVKAALEADPTPEADFSGDPVFGVVLPGDTDMRVEDVSSRVNPNWERPETLFSGRAIALLRQGADAEAFRQWREDEGLDVDVERHYGSWFSESAFACALTGHSYANVNSADEFALRALALDRLGDAFAADSFRAKVRAARMERRTIAEADLAAFCGADAAALLPIITTAGQCNVNLASIGTIAMIASMPATGIRDPDAFAGEIETARRSGEIDLGRLRGLLGAAADAATRWFGTETFFWRVTVDGEGGETTFTLARILGKQADGKRVYSIVKVEKALGGRE